MTRLVSETPYEYTWLLNLLSVWSAGVGENFNQWTCLACDDHKWRVFGAAHRHESSGDHKTAVAYRRRKEAEQAVPDPLTPNPAAVAAVHGTLHDLLTDIRVRSPSPDHWTTGYDNDNHIELDEPELHIDWDQLLADGIGTEIEPSARETAYSNLVHDLNDWLLFEDDDEDDSDAEQDERSDTDGEPGEYSVYSIDANID